MKKFAFSLERIYGFKQTVLDKEKLTLAALRAQLAEIEAEIDSILVQLSALNAEKLQKAGLGTTIFELKKLDYQINVSNKILAELYITKDIKNIEIQRQLNVVMQVKSEVQGLEKLKDKQKEEYDYELAKQTSEEIGEMISGKIVREKIPER